MSYNITYSIKFVKKLNPILVLLLIGILLNPLFFWPVAEIPFEIPKVWLIHRWIELLIIIGLTKGLIFPEFKLQQTKLWLLLGLLLSAILSTAVNHTWLESFWGNWYRADGLVNLFHLIALTITIYVYWQKKWNKYLVNTLIASAGIVSIWAVFAGLKTYLFLIPTQSEWQGAIGANFGQPNFLAGYLLVTLPLLIQKLQKSRQKSRWFLVLSLIAMALIFTKSNAAILGLLTIPPLTFFVYKLKQLDRKLIFGAVVLVSFFYHAGFILSGQNLFSGKPIGFAYPFEGRERIYSLAYKAWTEKPILGWGWANFAKAYDTASEKKGAKIDSYVDKAHSVSLEYLVTTGLIGFGIYWSLIYLSLKKLNRQYLAMFLVFILYSQTNVLSISTELLFWLMVGL